MSMKTIAGAAALAALLAGYAAVPAAQALTLEECFARFTGLDLDGDKQLSSSEAGQHQTGDANSDGQLSNDEFMKACEQGLYDAITQPIQPKSQ